MYREAEEERRTQEEEAAREEEENARQEAEEARRTQEEAHRRAEEEREKRISILQEEAETKIDELINMVSDGRMTHEVSAATMKEINETLEKEIRELKSGTNEEEEEVDQGMEWDVPASDEASPPPKMGRSRFKRKRVDSDDEEEEEDEEEEVVKRVEMQEAELPIVEAPPPVVEAPPPVVFRKRAPKKLKGVVEETVEKFGAARVRGPIVLFVP
jgi:hypothetical protein